MAKLEGDKAFRSSEIEELKRVGKETLQTAQEVSEEVEKSLAAISAELAKIPAAAKESGVEEAAEDLRKSIRKGNYRQEKNRLEKALTKLETAVPQTDKKLAGQLRQLSAATDRIRCRVADLEPFLKKGTADMPADRFSEKLEECRKVWEEEEKDLGKLIKAVKAGLKGLEVESCRYSSDPVNLSTGNFIYDKTDLAVKGEPGLSFRRFYNAQEPEGGVMGKGWVHNHELHVRESRGQVSLYLEDGKEEQYEEREDGTYRSLRGSLGTLKKTEEGWEQEGADGSIRQFDRTGACTRYADAGGKGLSFSYDEGGRLSLVREENGASFLSYAYDGEGRLIRVSDHTGRQAALSYGEDGMLSRVEGTEGAVYEYGYDREGRLNRVVNGEGTVTVKNSYDSEGRTRRQAFPDGSRMKYRYLEEEGAVELTERNGAKIRYYHDSRYRNIRTVYEDGEETDSYNRNGKRISHTDLNGNQTRYAYDGWGNLTEVADPLGNTTRMLYNGRGKLIRLSVNGKEKIRNRYDSRGNLAGTTDGEGNTATFSYDGENRLVCIRQADGSEVCLTYDERGNIIKIQDGEGRQAAYAYDMLNRVIEVQDGNGNATRYGYDGADRITEVSNAEGNTRHYTYNHAGKVTKVTDFDGAVTEYAYNCLNRVECATDPEGNRVRYAYDRMWNVCSVEDGEGGKTTYRYNLKNLLEKVEDAEGNCISYAYDACGNRTEVLGPEGEQTRLSYDALNRLVKTEEPDGTVTEYTYDGEGNVTEVKDSRGNSLKMEYDGNGRRLSETDRRGRTIRYAYDVLGNTTSVTDAAGRKTEYRYGAGGLLEQVTYPDGTWERYRYDGCRNVVRKERGDGYAINYTYDCMNRLVKMESSTGQEKSFRYDAVGNVASMTDGNGNETVYRYDRRGNLTGVTDAEGGEAVYCYDRNGRLQEIRQLPAGGSGEEHVTRYTRDLLGRITGVTDAMGQTEAFAYDGAGRLMERRDRDGYVTAYRYTAGGKLEHITYGDGKEVQFAYDGLGRLTEMKDWLGAMHFTHDEEGRLTGATDRRGKEVKYRYGTFGQREAVICPDGREITYGYDALLRLNRIRSGGQTAEYAYDAMGRLTERRTGSTVTEYGYDAAGLLTTLVHKGAEGILESYGYRYDPEGNRIREERYRKGMEEESGSYTYEYDRLHRLVRTVKDGTLLRSYGYDGFGNRMEKTEGGTQTRYTYNALNQLILDTDGTTEHRYAYDHRGNLTRILENGNLKHAYAFGAMNRMTGAADGMGNVAEYDYNGLGHRALMRQGRTEPALLRGLPDFREDGLLPEAPEIWEKETEYILDLTKGYHNLLQKEENGSIQSYVWDTSVLFMEENGESCHYLNDLQGSVMRLLSQDGQTRESYGYDEFGADLSGNQGQFQPFGYTGYQRDAVAGTYYAQVREYDTGAGRFTSEDIIKGYAPYPETLNAYGYCWGNPFKYVDRDGAFPGKSFMDTAGNVIDEVKEAASDAIEWAQSVWTQDIVGEDRVYVSDGDEQKSFEISTHTGGNVIVVKRNEKGKFRGWSVNGKVKFGDSGASVSAKLSGTGIDPRKWKFSENLKYKDTKTDITYGFGRYADTKGQGYTISASGAVGNIPKEVLDNIPEGALDDIPVEVIGDASWSMSYSGETTTWKNMLEAVATAGAIVGIIGFLAWLVGNDATGVGALDDASIPGVLAVLKNLVENFGQYLPQISGSAACGLE